MIQEKGIIRDIFDLQTQTTTNKSDNEAAIVFTFLRDPVVRFLSSVGQMLYMNRVRLFRQCDRLNRLERKFRLRENNTTIAKSQALVHCVLQSMLYPRNKSAANSVTYNVEKQEQTLQNYNYTYVDQHFLPQAIELRARSLEFDIGIHLMPMSEMSSALRVLVGPERQGNHARSSTPEYTQGYYLDPSILTTGMLHVICRQLYAVDVLLLKATRIASTLCDSIPPVGAVKR
jgi:hypothetical protein